MSRLTSDRNQQQPQQPNQNQQIVQQQSVPVQNARINNQGGNPQQFLTLAQSGSYLIINNPSEGLRAPSSTLNSGNNIFYPNNSTNTTATSSSSSSVATNPVVISHQANVITPVASSLSTSTITSSHPPTSPIAKKRLKLDNIAADSSSSCGSTTEDLAALKKRIYEHKLQRLKNLKEK